MVEAEFPETPAGAVLSALFPAPPEGYRVQLMADRNRLIAMCGALPVLWLDESLMEWQVLDQHISQVQDALEP